MSLQPPKPSPPNESYGLGTIHSNLSTPSPGGIGIPLASRLPHESDNDHDIDSSQINEPEPEVEEQEETLIPVHSEITNDFNVSSLNNRPLSASVVTPILQSRFWLLLIASACLVMGFLWVKEATDALRFQSGFLPKVVHFIKLVAAYFFFVHPAYKLWLLKKEISTLQDDPDEDSVGMVLFHQANFWKYIGIVVTAYAIYSLAALILSKLSTIFSL